MTADSGGDGFHVPLRTFEQELMTRWGIQESLSFPAFKVTEADEQPAEQIDQNQMLTGALLWVSTRTRPDIALVFRPCAA